jgi:Fe2+ transport system protein FeoA
MIPDEGDRNSARSVSIPLPAAESPSACRLCPLSGLGCDVVGRVVALSGPTSVQRRLLALGLRPGATCRVVGRAPAGGPLHVRAGSVHLMLRAHEAAGVTIGVDGGAPDGLPAV